MKSERRSGQAFIIEKALMIKKNRKSGQEGTFKKGDELPYTLPRMVYKSKVALEDFADRQVIRFTPANDADKTVIYVHGGAYVSEITQFHVHFCDKLCAQGDVNVIAPLYGLAPAHTWEEAYPFILALYLEEAEKGKPIVLMGDSAGGGFVTAFSEYLAEGGYPLPNRVCLISPWLDITMPLDYSEIIDNDPMLDVEELRKLGALWAGTLDHKDYKVSPTYGDVAKFPPSLIFTGTHEIFKVDIVEFCRKLENAGRETELVIAEKMDHVYPLYPIPEAKKAMDTILDWIK